MLIVGQIHLAEIGFFLAQSEFVVILIRHFWLFLDFAEVETEIVLILLIFGLVDTEFFLIQFDFAEVETE